MRLDLGVPLPIITESVFARFISAMKDERVEASKMLTDLKLKHLKAKKRA